jgi:hypothetical protein
LTSGWKPSLPVTLAFCISTKKASCGWCHSISYSKINPFEPWLRWSLSGWVAEPLYKQGSQALFLVGHSGGSLLRENLSNEFILLHPGVCDGWGLANFWGALKVPFLLFQYKILGFFSVMLIS